MWRVYSGDKIGSNEAFLGWDQGKTYCVIVYFSLQEMGSYPNTYKLITCHFRAKTPYTGISDEQVTGSAILHPNNTDTPRAFSIGTTAANMAEISSQFSYAVDTSDPWIEYDLTTASGHWSGTITAADITRRSSGADPVTAWTINGRSSGIGALTFGTAAAFAFTARNAEYRYMLTLSISPASVVAAETTLRDDIGAGGTSFSETVPESMISHLAANAQSGTAAFRLYTYAGETLPGDSTAAALMRRFLLVGSSAKNARINLPATYKPVISSVTIEEAAELPAAIDFYVQRYSMLQILTEAFGIYGASIQSIGVSVSGAGNYSGGDVTTGPLGSYGSVTVRVTVTDTRGASAVYVEQITVIQYDPPEISGCSAFRCAGAADPTADDAGAYACVIPSARISPLNGENTFTCRAYYKKTTLAAYDYITIPSQDYVFDTEYGIFAADTGAAYNVYIEITDIFENVARYNLAPLPATGALIDIRKDRTTIGIFQKAPAGVPGLHVNGDVYITGRSHETDTVTPATLGTSFQDAAPAQITAAATTANAYIPIATYRCGDHITTLCIEAATGALGVYEYDSVAQTGAFRAL